MTHKGGRGEPSLVWYAFSMNIAENRARVHAAVKAGAATILPAGARGNPTALVLIDGEVVGQASTYAVGYNIIENGRFGEGRLIARNY